MNNTENTAWNAAENNRRANLTFRVGIIVEARFDEKGYAEEGANWTNEDQNHSYRGALYRVEMADSKTYWMPMMVLRAGNDQSYWAFEVGEQVAVLCASGDPMQSVIIGALYQNDYRPPIGLDDETSYKRPWRASVKRERFADNTMFEYDREKHRFTASFLSADDNQFQYQGDSDIRKLGIHLKEIYTQADGNVTVDADGTTLHKSGGDATLESGATIYVKSNSDVNVEAGATINIKGGGNVNIDTGATVSIKGGTITAEGGSVSIEGGTVEITGMINLN